MDCFKQQVTLAHLNWLLTHHKTDIKTFLTEVMQAPKLLLDFTLTAG